MNKQTFTIEIESFDTAKPLKDFQLFSAVSDRLQELLNMGFRVSSVTENNVEQNVERPQNKTIELLEKAESVLSDSEHRYHWAVSKELRNHLDKLQGKEE